MSNTKTKIVLNACHGGFGLSTDAAEYQRVALEAGADCPGLRAPSLAADSTSSADVVEEVLNLMGPEATRYRGLVLLQPAGHRLIVERSPVQPSLDLESSIVANNPNDGRRVFSF